MHIVNKNYVRLMANCYLNSYFYKTKPKTLMEIKYQLFEAENLLVQKYIGNFSMEEFAAYARFSGMNFASKPI